jgi:hypothetical protein
MVLDAGIAVSPSVRSFGNSDETYRGNIEGKQARAAETAYGSVTDGKIAELIRRFPPIVAKST